MCSTRRPGVFFNLLLSFFLCNPCSTRCAKEKQVVDESGRIAKYNKKLAAQTALAQKKIEADESDGFSF